MCHDQHVTDGRFTFRFPNSFIVEARSYVVDQLIQPFRDVRRRFSPWATIPPNIPHLLPGFCSLLSYLRTRQAFVVSVVPFPYVFCDLHFCFCTYVAGSVGVLPGKFVAAANVEEFEGAASPGARGYVAKRVPWSAPVQSRWNRLANPNQEYGMCMRKGVHVGELGGNNEPVIAHQRSACGADSLLAVLC